VIPGLVAHLWQATLFAGAVWLVNLALRKNRAQVRYWVWFAASMKFLLPFSLLVGLGTLAPRRVAAPQAQRWVAAAEEIGQPLVMLPAVTGRMAAAADGTNRSYSAVVAAALWALGFAAVAGCWMARWRRVQALCRSATMLGNSGGPGFAIPVMSAPGLVEPGIFGMIRPVLLLPEGIEERLDRAQLDAVLAHEFCHVRRRDNLTAAIHMGVQAIFWFHPLVWWLGARLVDERERACDEEVVRLGNSPPAYAEAILNVCRQYVESPLACVSGVAGANLRKRIEAIMSNRSVLGLNFTKRMILACAGLLVLALPVAVGILHAPAIRAQARQAVPAEAAPSSQPVPSQAAPSPQGAPPTNAAPVFEVASIRLNTGCETGGGRFAQSPVSLTLPCLPLRALIRTAYSPTQAGETYPTRLLEVLGGPGWLDTDRYDISAKASRNASFAEMIGPMFQTLLEERFKLKVHKESRDAPVYELTVLKDRLKLQPSKEGSCVPMDLNFSPRNLKPGEAMPKFCGFGGGTGKEGRSIADWYSVSMAELADRMITHLVDRPVIDRTGLTGRYDVHLEYVPDLAPGRGRVLLNGVERPDLEPSPSDSTGPSIFTALEAQLGLKLSPGKGSVEVIVVDHAEKPSAN
jgi:uncharacterized protein (TIGR03435 family)